MNDNQIELGRRICLLTGRGLLGLYFIIPGISKITGFEQTSVYIADRLDVAGGYFAAEDIRYTGVIGAAEQVPPVRGEYETLRQCVAEVE